MAHRGKPLPILGIGHNGKPKLMMKNLEKVFLNPCVSNSNIAIISINGPTSNDSVFLFNMLLSFMNVYDGIGKDIFTEGISIWSQPFQMIDSNGNKIAVFLMSSKGVDQNVFLLSCLLSSVQIFTLESPLDSNLGQLNCFEQLVKFFEQYSDQHGNGHSPFQQLVFFLKDWKDERYKYGFNGGKLYLNNVSETCTFDYAKMIKDILKSFQTECFLMPHLGGDSNGNWKSYYAQFTTFASSLLENGRIVPKFLNKQLVTGTVFCEYAQSLVDRFRNSDVIDPEIYLKIIAASSAKAVIKRQIFHYNDKNNLKRVKMTSQQINSVFDNHNIVLQECIFNYLTAMQGYEKCDESISLHQMELWSGIEEVYHTWIIFQSDITTKYLKIQCLKFNAVLAKWKIEKNELSENIKMISEATYNSKVADTVSKVSSLLSRSLSSALMMTPAGAVASKIAGSVVDQVVKKAATLYGLNASKFPTESISSLFLNNVQQCFEHYLASMNYLHDQLTHLSELTEDLNSIYQISTYENLQNMVNVLNSAKGDILKTKSVVMDLKSSWLEIIKKLKASNSKNTDIAGNILERAKTFAKVVEDNSKKSSGSKPAEQNIVSWISDMFTSVLGENGDSQIIRTIQGNATIALNTVQLLYEVYNVGQSFFDLKQENRDILNQFLTMTVHLSTILDEIEPNMTLSNLLEK